MKDAKASLLVLLLMAVPFFGVAASCPQGTGVLSVLQLCSLAAPWWGRCVVEEAGIQVGDFFTMMRGGFDICSSQHAFLHYVPCWCIVVV